MRRAHPADALIAIQLSDLPTRLPIILPLHANRRILRVTRRIFRANRRILRASRRIPVQAAGALMAQLASSAGREGEACGHDDRLSA